MHNSFRESGNCDMKNVIDRIKLITLSCSITVCEAGKLTFNVQVELVSRKVNVAEISIMCVISWGFKLGGIFLPTRIVKRERNFL